MWWAQVQLMQGMLEPSSDDSSPMMTQDHFCDKHRCAQH